MAAELGVRVEDAQEAISNLVTGRDFSFMTAGLSSQYLWWEAVDMLRKLSIVGTGTLLPALLGDASPAMRVVLVLLVSMVWLVVQVRVQPYRLGEDNVLKTACDLVIVTVCALELAYNWAGSENLDADMYAVLFVTAMVGVLASCTFALGVKICRLMVHTGSTSHAPHAVLALMDGAPDIGAPGGADAAPEHLQEEKRAMSKFCAMGVVSGREEKQLRSYFERVRISEGKRQQMFKEGGGAPWVFVSTPERIPDGRGGHDQVMEFIQGICRERPWQFKQAFDWASSGNSYPADSAAWADMKPDMTAWFKAIKTGDEDGAFDNIKHNIAPVFLGLDWCSAWATLHTSQHTTPQHAHRLSRALNHPIDL